MLLLLTLVYHVILLTIGTPDLGAAFGAYFGAWLYGGAVLAVTMIWSAVTEDQIVAAFLGAATVLVLYLAEIAAAWIGGQQTGGSSSGLCGFRPRAGLAGALRLDDGARHHPRRRHPLLHFHDHRCAVHHHAHR